MAGPPTSGHAQWSFVFTGQSLPLEAVCTLGQVIGTGTTTEKMDICQAALEDLVPATLASTAGLAEIRYKVGPVATGATTIRTVSIAGAQNSATDNPSTSVLVRKRIQTLSNRFAGRLFWPAPSSVDVENGGHIGSASVTQFQDAFDDFYDAMVTGIGNLEVFTTLASDPRIMTGFTVMGQIANQRRRNRR